MTNPIGVLMLSFLAILILFPSIYELLRPPNKAYTEMDETVVEICVGIVVLFSICFIANCFGTKIG